MWSEKYLCQERKKFGVEFLLGARRRRPCKPRFGSSGIIPRRTPCFLSRRLLLLPHAVPRPEKQRRPRKADQRRPVRNPVPHQIETPQQRRPQPHQKPR